MPTISAIDLLMQSSSRFVAESLSLYAPFTRSFEGCYFSVEYLTEEVAKDPGYTIFGTYLLFTDYGHGINRGWILKPNCHFYPPTWGIETFPVPNVTFISPPRSFLRSQHA